MNKKNKKKKYVLIIYKTFIIKNHKYFILNILKNEYFL